MKTRRSLRLHEVQLDIILVCFGKFIEYIQQTPKNKPKAVKSDGSGQENKTPVAINSKSRAKVTNKI